MPKKKEPTLEQLARVVSILETYGDGSEPGIFRVADVDACRAVAKNIGTRSVMAEKRRLDAEAWERVQKKFGVCR